VSGVRSLDPHLLAIERAAVRAWPAGKTANIDGWHWRYSGGASQRANSVSTLDFTGADVNGAIDAAEAKYRALKTVARFQTGDASSPDGIEAALRARNYRWTESVNALARDIAPVKGAMPDEVEVTTSATDDWLAVYLAGITDDRRPAAPAILARIPEQRGFVLVRRNGEPVATALGVITDDIVIVECVMTNTAARRTGAANLVMHGLEQWAANNGARMSGLQAVTSNAPAQALYARLGYTELGRQHYFVLDT
jgi:N-acetylglutamate synthase